MKHIETVVCISPLKRLTFVHISYQICNTVDKLLAEREAAALIKQLNPSFQAPSRPFMRLAYVDAISLLNDHGIQHEEEDAEGNVIKDDKGNPKMVDHVVSEDIAEAAERRFPAELKAFYMKKMPNSGEQGGKVFTESCDLLMPGVGEIVGAS